MRNFTFSARDTQGRLVRGILEAETSTAVADRLRKRGYLVTRLEETVSLPGWMNLEWHRSIPEEGLLLASIQLANMVSAGVPLVSSLQTVASQTSDRPLREALEAVTQEIETGSTFSEALSFHGDIFPGPMISMVRVGEASGHLDAVLTRFSNAVEKDLNLKKTIQAALTYPALLLAAATVLIVFVVSFIVPQFGALFTKAGVPLPLPTQILQTVGLSIRHFWWLLGMVAIGSLATLRVAVSMPSLRLKIDAALLKLPGVGPVIYQTTVARFARSLGTLVGAGLPILSALDTAQVVVGNRVVGEEIKRVRSAVEQGARLAATLSTGKVFAPDCIQMVRVGEESGRLEIMLEKIADFYELRVGFAIKQMTTLLEPILLVVMGGLVAFIMASLLLPMFDMLKVFKGGGLR